MSEKCHGIGFTELVRCGYENSHKIAHGWTASTGRGGGYPYKPPSGWEFDPNYGDIPAGPYGCGSHGGCSGCIMTLVHLRSTAEVAPPKPVPETIPGDRDADYPVGAERNKLITLVIIFGITFLIASRWF